MRHESSRRVERDYVPAAPQLWLYDVLVAVLSRESRWRTALIRQVDPRPLREVGFDGVEEAEVVPTPTGSISLYRARRAR